LEAADASGVDEHVEAPEGRHRLGHRGPHRLGAGDVAGGAGCWPAGLAKKLERLADPVAIHVDEEDLSPFGREALRGCAADARSAAGQEHDPIGEASAHGQPSMNTPRASSPRCRAATAPASSSSGYRRVRSSSILSRTERDEAATMVKQ